MRGFGDPGLTHSRRYECIPLLHQRSPDDNVFYPTDEPPHGSIRLAALPKQLCTDILALDPNHGNVEERVAIRRQPVLVALLTVLVLLPFLVADRVKRRSA